METAVVDGLHLEGLGTPKILMVHGLGYASWEASILRDEMPNSGLWSLDNRGTGRSGPTGELITIDSMADDVISAIEAMGGPMALIGHSMGGYITQVVVARRPDLVSRVVLLSTSPGGPASSPVPPSTIEAWVGVSGLEPDEYARATMPLSFRDGWTEENPEEFETLLRARLSWPTPSAVWEAQFEACERFLALGPQVHSVHPTLIVHGSGDRVVPVENGRLLSGLIPHSRYVEFEDAGHLVHLEQTSMVAAHISDFIA